MIELLAVITIMGILMVVAIPTVGRTIENVRRDSFLDTAKQYVNGVKMLWQSDSLMCGSYMASELGDGAFYVPIDSSETTGPGEVYPTILESGGKSSWGNRDVHGYVIVILENVMSGTASVKYRVVLTDGTHGIVYSTLDYTDLKRAHVLTSGAEITDPESGTVFVSAYDGDTWFVDTACVEV